MIDTHTHIYEGQFDHDRADVVSRAKAANVQTILLPNEDENSLDRLSATCAEFPVCRALYGLHPTEVRENYKEQLETIFSFAEKQANVVGVGEIGLDLYWDKSKADIQAEAFALQIQYSIEHRLPMSIHIREAFDLFFDVVSQFPNEQIVGSLHCFSGSIETAQQILNSYPNLSFGFNGTCTYKKSHLPDVLRMLPKNKILLETDAPYLAPIPNRGKRNEPSFLTFVLEHISKNLNISPIELDQITTDNARSLFQLDNLAN